MDNNHRVAVWGCGYWGQNLVRNFYALGALSAICEVGSEGRAKAAQLAPGVPIYDNIAPTLAASDISGIVIATPAATHAELCLTALKAGKDVFCEKPLALRYEDAYQATKIAQEESCILMVGHILEYHPGILKLRELIDQNQLGQLRYIYSNRLSFGKIRRVENILWSFAPHDIAVILRLIGEMPFQVTASGGAYIQPNIADMTVTQLLFDNGVAAHIFLSWLNPFKEQKLVVVGSERMATFDDIRKELILYDQQVKLDRQEPVSVKSEGIQIPYALNEPLRLECEAFLHAIETRISPLTDADSGLRVLRILQAAQRSLITHGQPIVLPIEYAI